MSYDERSMLLYDLGMLRPSFHRKCLDIIAMHEPWFEIKPDEDGNEIDLESYNVETLKALRVFVDSCLSKSRYTIMLTNTITVVFRGGFPALSWRSARFAPSFRSLLPFQG